MKISVMLENDANFDPATKVYSASLHTKQWSKEPESLQNLIDKGGKITPARLHGNYTLWVDGKNMAALFISKTAQIAFLRKNDMLNESKSTDDIRDALGIDGMFAKAPYYVNYIAVDADGSIFGYESKPSYSYVVQDWDDSGVDGTAPAYKFGKAKIKIKTAPEQLLFMASDVVMEGGKSASPKVDVSVSDRAQRAYDKAAADMERAADLYGVGDYTLTDKEEEDLDRLSEIMGLKFEALLRALKKTGAADKSRAAAIKKYPGIWDE